MSDQWDKLPFVPAVSDVENFRKDENDYLIICDGNSITRHGTSESIVERLGWRITAGMAASDESRDYAHVLAGLIQSAMPEKRVKLLFTCRQVVKNVSPDLVVIQGGEHCRIEDLDSYREEYRNMIREYQELNGEKCRIILISIWNPTCQKEFFECTGENYQTNALLIRAMQQQAAVEFKVDFADMSGLENIPENTGYGEVAAVRWHPSDAGMRSIAGAVFKLWEKR